MTEFMDGESGVFGDEAFRHLLSREAMRATRYQDFFSVCLVKADGDTRRAEPGTLEGAVSEKLAGILRSTDLVGRLEEGRIGVLLLHTEGTDASRVAERLREHIERVAFHQTASSGRPVTLSVGAVSFPRDGFNDLMLLSRADAHLEEAVRRGGNRVVFATEGAEPGSAVTS